MGGGGGVGRHRILFFQTTKRGKTTEPRSVPSDSERRSHGDSMGEGGGQTVAVI